MIFISLPFGLSRNGKYFFGLLVLGTHKILFNFVLSWISPFSLKHNRASWNYVQMISPVCIIVEVFFLMNRLNYHPDTYSHYITKQLKLVLSYHCSIIVYVVLYTSNVSSYFLFTTLFSTNRMNPSSANVLLRKMVLMHTHQSLV